jgi:hypothetical protein
MATAFAKADGPKLDRALGYLVDRPSHQPVDADVAQAFTGLSSGELTRLANQIAGECRQPLQDAEDAVQDEMLALIEYPVEILGRKPSEWMGLLHARARMSCRRTRSRSQREDSYENLAEGRDSQFLERASPRAETHQGIEISRLLRRANPGARWSREEILGAITRFRDFHGRPPITSEFKPLNGLPCYSALRRHFKGVPDAVLAAGMTPNSPLRRAAYTPLEAARKCKAFRIKEGRWPDWADSRNPANGVPSTSTMMRIFGSTRAGEIHRVAEAIITNGEVG